MHQQHKKDDSSNRNINIRGYVPLEPSDGVFIMIFLTFFVTLILC